MLDVKNLHVYLDTDDGIVKAVDGVSFKIGKGETVGIVGESGSGKSVLASSIMQLNPQPPTFYPKGEIWFDGKNMLAQSDAQLAQLRGDDVAMVFQDPMSSLNPVFRIDYQLIEAIRAHRNLTKRQARMKAVELLQDVGIPNPSERMHRYPHEFSGGMRQRVLIAIALAGNPKLLIADEPTTALDVTIQAQILDLLRQIQKKYGTSILMITHDLGVVANLCDRVLVMYAGRIVESGSVDDIFYRTAMPYTLALLESVPRLDAHNRRLESITGQPPSLTNLPKGCHFYDRCPFRKPACKEIDPALTIVEKGHEKACILSEDEFHTAAKRLKKQKEVNHYNG